MWWTHSFLVKKTTHRFMLLLNYFVFNTPLGRLFISSKIFTIVKCCCVWTKKPRSLPQKMDHEILPLEPLGLFHFQSLPRRSKITKCYHVQPLQAWLARQHNVPQERMRKRFWILKFNTHLYIKFQIGNHSRQNMLFAVIKRHALRHWAVPRQSEKVSRSNCAGRREICHPFVSALWTSGWIASKGVRRAHLAPGTPFLSHPCAGV